MAGKKGDAISVQITRKFAEIKIRPARLKRLVADICKRFGVSHALVTVILADNVETRRINKHFLNYNRLTDCLSFDLSDEDTGDKHFELVVNAEMALREAQRRGHSGEAEVALYIIHGLLHHFGFDDLRPSQAEIMHRTEDEILRQQGYGAVYYT